MKPLLLALAALVPFSLAACSGDADASDNTVHAGDSGETTTGQGGAPSNESERAVVSYMEDMDQIVTALEGVEDQATADKAAEVISSMSTRWEGQVESWKALAQDEMDAARERYAEDLGRVQGEMMVALTKLMKNPSLAGPLQSAIQALPELGK